MRKSAFDSVGGYSESMKYKRVEDYDLWTRLYKAGYVGYNIQEPLYSMRDDADATDRRTLCNRKNEARVKKNIVKWFNFSIINYAYVLLPIIKGIVPRSIYVKFHKE